MAATKVESLTNPRDSLPNTYTSITAREVDFVTRFNDNWDALRAILGIMRPIRKTPGTQLISYTADVTLEDGDVDPGNVIPYSKATITQATKADLTIKKYAKAVPIEDVDKYGSEIAVEKSDDAFLTKLQNVVLGDFYTFLNTGSLTGTAATWQAALAKAQGQDIGPLRVSGCKLRHCDIFWSQLPVKALPPQIGSPGGVSRGHVSPQRSLHTYPKVGRIPVLPQCFRQGPDSAIPHVFPVRIRVVALKTHTFCPACPAPPGQRYRIPDHPHPPGSYTR